MQNKPACPSPADKSTGLAVIIIGMLIGIIMILFPGMIWNSLVPPVGTSSYLLAMYIIGWIVIAIFLFSLVHYLLNVGKCRGIIYGQL